jgi:hypothetical protein
VNSRILISKLAETDWNWGGTMSFEVTDVERTFLLELLEARYTAMLHELHHTDSYEYKELLQEKVQLLESLKKKLEYSSSVMAAE